MKHFNKEATPLSNISPENWNQKIQERMLTSDSTILLLKQVYSNLSKNEQQSTRDDLAKLIKFETFLQNKWYQYFEEWTERNNDETPMNQHNDQPTSSQNIASKTEINTQS